MGLFNSQTPFLVPIVLGDINKDSNFLLLKAPQAMVIKSIYMGVGTGIAQDESNHVKVSVKSGATVVADFYTKTTGGDAALTADVPVSIPIETGEGSLSASDILKVDVDLSGTTVIDELWMQIEGYYV